MKLRIQITVALFAIFAIFSAYQGIADIRSSTASDVTELYGIFADGPLVLLLPLVAALLVGLPIATRIQSRFYASTRTRINMSSLLLRDVATGVGMTALFCVGLSLV